MIVSGDTLPSNPPKKHFGINHSNDDRSSKNNNMKISVIDSFSIIAPRLGFSDEQEVVCTNHFICRSDIMQHPGQ